MKKLLTGILATIMLVSSVACTSTETSQIKVAASTFVSAMAIVQPAWASTTFQKDMNAAIAAWGVGNSWKTNVANELVAAQGEVKTIPNCDTQCQELSSIVLGALTAELELVGYNPSTQAQISAAEVNKFGIDMNMSTTKPAAKNYTKHSLFKFKKGFDTKTYKGDWNTAVSKDSRLAGLKLK